MNDAKVSKILKYALVAVAAAQLAIFFIAIYKCIVYPYDLDWIEGGMLSEVVRVVSGKPLYAEPSIEFTAFIYAPLYIYLSAALSHLAGAGFLTLRLFSLACTAGTLALIYLFVWRETGRHWLPMLACAVYAKGFLSSGGHLNLVRVDHLFIFLSVASAYMLRFHETARGYVAAGLYAALAFLAKQSALILLLPLVVYAVVYGKRKSAYFIVTAAVLSAASYFLLNYHYDGWYQYYVFHVPSEHELIKPMLLDFWTADMLPFGVVLFVSVLFLSASASSGDRKTALFYGMLFCGAVAGAWISRLHRGGMYNVLLTMFPAMSVMFALGIWRILASDKVLFRNALMLACMVRLGHTITAPLGQVPTAADYMAGADFVNIVRQQKGDVFLPYQNYIATDVGKKPCANYMAIIDVLEGGSGATEQRFLADIRYALDNKRFGAVILYPGTMRGDIEQVVEDNYLVTRELVYPEARYWANGTTVPSMYVCVRE